jgi:hypothetical protein
MRCTDRPHCTSRSRNRTPLASTPKVMSDGNWRLGVFIDAAASDEQAEKLGGVFSGALGGDASVGPLVGRTSVSSVRRSRCARTACVTRVNASYAALAGAKRPGSAPQSAALHPGVDHDRTHEILDTVPTGVPLSTAAVAAAIDACLRRVQTCTTCANADLAQEDIDELRACAALRITCADVCDLTARVLSRPAQSDQSSSTTCSRLASAPARAAPRSAPSTLTITATALSARTSAGPAPKLRSAARHPHHGRDQDVAGA